MNLDERIALVTRSPVGAQMFVEAGRQRLGPEQLADPAAATALAYEAQAALDPWTGEHRRWVTDALDAVGSQRALIADVLADPRNDWWWSDLDRERQLWLSDVPWNPTDLAGTGPISRWENYAQRPAPASRVITSTELSVPAGSELRSGLHAEITSFPATDWNPTFPLGQASLTVADSARVWEVHEPNDWHRLCLDYGAPEHVRRSDENLLAAGIDNGPAPTWSAVATAWDGVHLSLFGFITSVYQPVESNGITTTLWSWESERTQWLRDVFTSRIELEPLMDPHAP